MTLPFLTVVQAEPPAGAMRALVSRVFAMHGAGVPPESLCSLPCDASLLHVHLTGNPEFDHASGERTFFTGIRPSSVRHTVGGDFLTLFAVFTPLGAVALLEGAAIGGISPCVGLGSLVGLEATRSLEQAVCSQSAPDLALQRFGHWLEDRLVRRRAIPEAAWRVARVSCELSHEPGTKVVDAALRQAISQRQLERDMQRWFNLRPKQYAQTAQFQQLLNAVGRERSLADAALRAGFADQAHMTRAVKRFTGMTPRQLFAAVPGPIATSFRQASPRTWVFV